MLLFVLWALFALGGLAGAGYSHYRYRVRNDQYYQRLFARQPGGDAAVAPEWHTNRVYLVPVLTLVMVSFLLPISFFI